MIIVTLHWDKNQFFVKKIQFESIQGFEKCDSVSFHQNRIFEQKFDFCSIVQYDRILVTIFPLMTLKRFSSSKGFLTHGAFKRFDFQMYNPDM